VHFYDPINATRGHARLAQFPLRDMKDGTEYKGRNSGKMDPFRGATGG